MVKRDVPAHTRGLYTPPRWPPWRETGAIAGTKPMGISPEINKWSSTEPATCWDTHQHLDVTSRPLRISLRISEQAKRRVALLEKKLVER
ncbi:hypothetical protein J6590_029185 [Homalodisca vitripennis]|nr:hypothetical protein J6590_029185 [Homalodisca vitripennis]